MGFGRYQNSLGSENHETTEHRNDCFGSVPEWPEFFARGAKPSGRFQDRLSALLMAGVGWIGEWRLFEGSSE